MDPENWTQVIGLNNRHNLLSHALALFVQIFERGTCSVALASLEHVLVSPSSGILSSHQYAFLTSFQLSLKNLFCCLWWGILLILALGRWRQADFCVFQASLFYTASSKQARTAWWDLVSCLKANEQIWNSKIYYYRESTCASWLLSGGWRTAFGHWLSSSTVESWDESQVISLA